MEERIKILVADDDAAIREVIRILLESEGYEIIEAEDGNAAVALMDHSAALVILDVLMPGISGVKTCELLRTEYMTPVLFLTAKSGDADKVMGFMAGGDDYLIKPFSYTELLSRVKALIRRCYQYSASSHGLPSGSLSKMIYIHNLQIDLDRQQVTESGNEIDLTDIEYQILVLLAANRRKIFSTQNIYESVWNEPYYAISNNTVTVHIRNIRKKLEPGSENPKYIQNVWGRGYRIV